MKDKMLERYEQCDNLKDLLKIRAELRPDVPIYAIYGRRAEEPPVEITTAELMRQIDALGTWFFYNGYRGRHVAILGENSYEWILTFFSLINGNNTAVLLDTTKPAEELCNVVSDCDAEAIVFSEAYAKMAASIKVNTGVALIPMSSLAEKMEEGAALLYDGCRDFVEHVTDSECMSVICCTSGTTGRSKGVMISHKNIVSDVIMALHSVYYPDFGKTFMLLPLYHIYSLVINMFMAVGMGGTVCFTGGIRSFAADYLRIRPELLYLVPRLFEVLEMLIAKQKEEAAVSGKEVFLPKYIFSGGATPEMSLIRKFVDMGVVVTVGYGLTETTAGVSQNSDFIKWTDGSMAFFPGQKYRIDHPDANGVGELCLAGDNIMLGYYKMPEETDKKLKDGWLYTGDLAVLTSEDRMILKGRKDRMMVLPNGLNVPPEEIEADIRLLDGVTEVMVLLENDRITARIYAEDPEKRESIREGINRINRNCSAYRETEEVVFLDEPLPKTASGKIKYQSN